jgi:hypothetical protein
MWAEAGHRVLARHRPDLASSAEQFHHPLSIGLPWLRPDLGHPDLATTDEWWQAVYRHYADVYTAMGWSTSARTRHADCVAATAFGVNAILVRTAEGFEPRVDDLWGVMRMVIDHF